MLSPQHCRERALAKPLRILLAVTLSVLADIAIARVHGDAGSDFERAKRDNLAAVSRLTAKGTPDALATAALLKRSGSEEDEGAYSLVARAVESAPGRSDIAWLAIRLCSSAADCDPAGAEQHLRTVDPANGAGWLGALTRAGAANDTGAVDAALAAIGDAGRLNVYFNPLTVATTREIVSVEQVGQAKVSRKELTNATVRMIGIMAAAALPGLQTLSYSCRGNLLQIAGRLERCRRAAQAFEHGDTYIVEGLGLSLQQRLWSADSPEGRAVTDRRRAFQYRLEVFNKLPWSTDNQSTLPADYLDVLQAHEREQDSARVYLQRAKIPLDPPAHWVSTMPPRVP
jgi:hypothetical protein